MVVTRKILARCSTPDSHAILPSRPCGMGLSKTLGQATSAGAGSSRSWDRRRHFHRPQEVGQPGGRAARGGHDRGSGEPKRPSMDSCSPSVARTIRPPSSGPRRRPGGQDVGRIQWGRKGRHASAESSHPCQAAAPPLQGAFLAGRSRRVAGRLEHFPGLPPARVRW